MKRKTIIKPEYKEDHEAIKKAIEDREGLLNSSIDTWKEYQTNRKVKIHIFQLAGILAPLYVYYLLISSWLYFAINSSGVVWGGVLYTTPNELILGKWNTSGPLFILIIIAGIIGLIVGIIRTRFSKLGELKELVIIVGVGILITLSVIVITLIMDKANPFRFLNATSAMLSIGMPLVTYYECYQIAKVDLTLVGAVHYYILFFIESVKKRLSPYIIISKLFDSVEKIFIKKEGLCIQNKDECINAVITRLFFDPDKITADMKNILTPSNYSLFREWNNDYDQNKRAVLRLLRDSLGSITLTKYNLINRIKRNKIATGLIALIISPLIYDIVVYLVNGIFT